MDQTGTPASARLRKATIVAFVLVLCAMAAWFVDGLRGLSLMCLYAALNLLLNARARRLRG